MKDELFGIDKTKDVNLQDYIDEDYARDRAITTANNGLLKQLIQALVDDPASVRVTPICGENTVVFEVMVAQPDIKRIVGRKGRIADALRQILVSLGAKAKKRYILEISEPDRRLDEIPVSAVKVRLGSPGRPLST